MPALSMTLPTLSPADISMITEDELSQLDASPPKIADLIHLTTVSQETILYTLRRRYDIWRISE